MGAGTDSVVYLILGVIDSGGVGGRPVDGLGGLVTVVASAVSRGLRNIVSWYSEVTSMTGRESFD